MTILGLILLLVGLIIGIKILFWIGLIILIVGAVLWITSGRGGRRVYY